MSVSYLGRFVSGQRLRGEIVHPGYLAPRTGAKMESHPFRHARGRTSSHLSDNLVRNPSPHVSNFGGMWSGPTIRPQRGQVVRGLNRDSEGGPWAATPSAR